MKTFYDIHTHAFTLEHPDILDFMENTFSRNKSKSNKKLKKRYRLQNMFKKAEQDLSIIPSLLGSIDKISMRIQNFLSISQNSIYDIFDNQFMDLHGEFRDDGEAYIKEGKFHFLEEKYDRFVMTPLIMDFRQTKYDTNRKIYYKKKKTKDVVEQYQDMLMGIKKFRISHPDSIIEIYPFLGINPNEYTKNTISNTLNHFFGNYTGCRQDLLQNFLELDKYQGDLKKIRSNVFAGIKLYPPLGFNPWPEDDIKEIEKLRFFYKYCEEKQIPITSHCSNNGWLVIPQNIVDEYTSPYKWEKVLEYYPKLKINLAHFGTDRVVRNFPRSMPNKWQEKIIEMICSKKYPNLYTDISYTGVYKNIYKGYNRLIENYINDKSSKEILIDKLLFGSDFTVNLAYVDSYFDYFKLFEDSEFKWKEIISTNNPEKFLFNQICDDEKIKSILERKGFDVIDDLFKFAKKSYKFLRDVYH